MAGKTLFLHIGFGKTGTSFIQSSLAFSRAKLKKNGVYYPVLTERREGKYGLMSLGNGFVLAQILNPSLRSEAFSPAAAWRQLEESIKGTTCNRVLISSEAMMLAQTSQLEELKKFLELRNISVKVIAFARSFLEHSFSGWSQILKRHGFTLKWEEVCRSQKAPFYSVLTKYVEVFGKENILVFNYDQRRDHLLETFSDILGIPEISTCPVAEVNRTLSAREMARMLFLSELSKLSAHHLTIQIFTTVSDLMVEVDPGTAERRIVQSGSAWEAFQKNNKEILESLNREFLQEEPVQMALRAPEFGEMILPELSPTEKHVLSAVHSFLANTGDGPKLKPEMVAQLNEPSLYILSSRVFRAQKMWDKAVWAAEQAVQRVPKEPRAYLELAKGHEKTGNLDAAMEAISKAVAMWPDMPNYHYLRGTLLHRLKRWSEAASALTEAVRLNPALPGAHRQLSTALLRLGRINEAVQAARVAVRRVRIVRSFAKNLGSISKYISPFPTSLKSLVKRILQRIRLIQQKEPDMTSHKRFKEIILHIGVHKTGTTTIQRAFFKNRRLLESQAGILYPGESPNHSIPLYSMFCEQPERYGNNIRKNITDRDSAEKLNERYYRTMEHEFINTAADRLLLSGEDLSLLSSDGVARLKQWLLKYTDHIRIIAWLREPVGWSLSAIQERIKGGSSNLTEASKNPPTSNYKERLEKYVSAFGIDAVELVDFDSALGHPEGIIGKFCDHLAIESNLRNTLVKTPRLNESLSYEAVLLINKINEKYPIFTNGKMTPGRWNNDIKPFTRIRGKKFRMDASALKLVEEKEHASLVWLYDQFGFSFRRNKTVNVHKEEELFNEDAISSIALTMFEEMQTLNAKLLIEKGNKALLKEIFRRGRQALRKVYCLLPRSG